MRKGFLIAAASMLAAGAPVHAQSAGHVLRGAGIGAAGGAVAGALLPGVSVGNGALVGAAGGAAYNGLINRHGHRRYGRGHHYAYGREYRGENRYYDGYRR